MFQFDWEDANRSHIALHQVLTDEVEQVLNGHPMELDSYEWNGEDRLEEVGSTAAVRIVTIIRNERFRVVTAFNATRTLKLRFLEHQRRTYE